MKILAIETSCDETAVSIIDGSGNLLKKEETHISVLSNMVLSQIELHREYGGIFPSLAKREHAQNLIPLIKESLKEAHLVDEKNETPKEEIQSKLKSILEREPEQYKQLQELIFRIKKPSVDAIAVTYGPGLEPALWVGLNTAKAFSTLWNIPLIPVNHMEGHLFSSLLKESGNEKQKNYELQRIEFPVLTLLISGGHTELVLMKDWFSYEIVGETRDDAVGEAFDKVARMLGLPYPGGPEIEKAAQKYSGNSKYHFELPRPMLHSGDFDFSFSGLKTAVRREIERVHPKNSKPTLELALELTLELAWEFQEAATEVLVEKTFKAREQFGVRNVLVAGGVCANRRIVEGLQEKLGQENVLIAPRELTGDNALMIAVAASMRSIAGKSPSERDVQNIKATGSLSIAS